MRTRTTAFSIQPALLGLAISTPAAAQEAATAIRQLDSVKVTGSRIPRAQVEGPRR